MDILRKELDEIYAGQRLEHELLDDDVVATVVEECKAMAIVSGMCAVVTDAAADRSFFLDGRLSVLLGLTMCERARVEIPSSDEDFLYQRIVPADLVDLRMLEYEFFRYVDRLEPDAKLRYRAIADVRMRCAEEKFVTISKSTQVVRLSPRGKMWLMLCTYNLLDNSATSTNPRIIDMETGEVTRYSFSCEKSNILTGREKEILNLIRAPR